MKGRSEFVGYGDATFVMSGCLGTPLSHSASVHYPLQNKTRVVEVKVRWDCRRGLWWVQGSRDDRETAFLSQGTRRRVWQGWVLYNTQV